MGISYTFNPFTGKLDAISVEDLSGYVPYSGAISGVNLGSFDITANSMIHKSITSDPGSVIDGTIWYRSDVDEFRVRAVGSTFKITVSPI